MAYNFNLSILGGRLTATPELKTTGGAADAYFSKFTIAVKTQNDTTDFFSCVAWGKTATFITKNFEKGSQICLTGEWHNRTYTDRNGQEKHETEYTVKTASFVDNAKKQPETAFSAGQDGKANLGSAEWSEVPADEELPF